MDSLKGKTTLISGASSGIGAAVARAFAGEGADLILAARRVERLAALAEELSGDYGVRCHYARLDVRSRREVADFVGSLPDGFTPIDVLVNNAGLARGLDPIPEGSLDDWDEMIDTNVRGLLHLTRVVTPLMLERGRGHIINIGSIAGRMVYPRGGVYCGTKFAERAITTGLMMDLVDTPLRVTTVDPGLVETEFSEVRFHGDRERAAAVYNDIDALRAADIADAVLYCATRPPHVNISEMVVLPTAQASPYHVHRKDAGWGPGKKRRT